MTYLKSIVVMPVAHRPELMALALERLQLAHDPPPIRIYADHVPAERENEIRHVFYNYAPSTTRLLFRTEHIKVESGCWNILQSLKDGYDDGADLVYLVEEDVMVHHAFFDYHYNAMTSQDVVASCGRNFKNKYTNPGSCLSRVLLKNVLTHVNDDYFSEPRTYLDRVFGEENESHLDDGLIRRVIKQMGGNIAFPEVPVAFHQGWQGYEERYDIYLNPGTIEQRIRGLRDIISRIQPGERYARDFETFKP